MKKTKLLASLAAFVLLIGLGACELPEEETSSEESSVTTETDTTVESDTTDTDTTPKETNPDGYVLVGDFIDSNWDSKVSEDSKYYIPLGTTEYKQTVTIAEEPDYGTYDPWDAGLRVVEWGDSWNLVVGSDELDEDSTGVTGNDASKNIKVKWGETYDITITFGETNSILVTLQEEGGNEGGNEPTTIDFSGKFDFTTNGVGQDLASTAMSSATDLDGFWTGDDLYVCCREYGSIWLGNAQNGAFQSNGLIKVGASGGQGVLNFKFAVGVNIEKVVVSAHSWTTNEANNLTINGETLAMPQSGSFEELTYEFEDEYQNILSFNCTSRGFVQYIEVYGTYTDSVEPITELVLSAEETNLNAGSNVEVTVSTVPTTGFDIDALVWTSNDENVVTVSQNLTGATVHAAGAGTATVTATAENGAKGEITFEVEDVLEESENIVISELNHGYSGNTKNATLTGHQVKITIDQNTDNGGDGNSSNAPLWSASSVRVYYNQTVTFEPLYENATITKIVITCDGNSYVGSSTATLKDLDGNTAGSVSADSTSGIVTIDVTSDGTIVYKNVKDGNNTQLRIKAFAITYTLAA